MHFAILIHVIYESFFIGLGHYIRSFLINGYCLYILLDDVSVQEVTEHKIGDQYKNNDTYINQGPKCRQLNFMMDYLSFFLFGLCLQRRCST